MTRSVGNRNQTPRQNTRAVGVGLEQDGVLPLRPEQPILGSNVGINMGINPNAKVTVETPGTGGKGANPNTMMQLIEEYVPEPPRRNVGMNETRVINQNKGVWSEEQISGYPHWNRGKKFTLGWRHSLDGENQIAELV